MSTMLKTLVREAKHHCKVHGITLSTLAGKAVGDGKLFARIEQGRGVEIATWEKVMKYIRDAEKSEGIIDNVDKGGGLGAVAGAEPKRKARARRARPSGGRSGARQAESTGTD